jgi:hypothetical protein
LTLLQTQPLLHLTLRGFDNAGVPLDSGQPLDGVTESHIIVFLWAHNYVVDERGRSSSFSHYRESCNQKCGETRFDSEDGVEHGISPWIEINPCTTQHRNF